MTLINEEGPVPLLKIHEVAEELGLSVGALYSRPFRLKLGLPGTKIGGVLRFDARDVKRIIEAGREQLPLMPEAAEASDAAD